VNLSKVRNKACWETWRAKGSVLPRFRVPKTLPQITALRKADKEELFDVICLLNVLGSDTAGKLHKFTFPAMIKLGFDTFHNTAFWNSLPVHIRQEAFGRTLRLHTRRQLYVRLGKALESSFTFVPSASTAVHCGTSIESMQLRGVAEGPYQPFGLGLHRYIMAAYPYAEISGKKSTVIAAEVPADSILHNAPINSDVDRLARTIDQLLRSLLTACVVDELMAGAVAASTQELVQGLAQVQADAHGKRQVSFQVRFLRVPELRLSEILAREEEDHLRPQDFPEDILISAWRIGEKDEDFTDEELLQSGYIFLRQELLELPFSGTLDGLPLSLDHHPPANEA